MNAVDAFRRIFLSVVVMVVCAMLLPAIMVLNLLEAVAVTGSVCVNVLASVWR